MAQEQAKIVAPASRLPRLSVDWWAVLASLVAAALILAGILPNIPW